MHQRGVEMWVYRSLGQQDFRGTCLTLAPRPPESLTLTPGDGGKTLIPEPRPGAVLGAASESLCLPACLCRGNY